MRVLLLAPLLMLTACATTASPPPQLAGTRWTLASADAGELAKSEAKVITAEFTADRITGNGGCNQYSGPWKLADGKLAIGPVAATKRYCADTSAMESAFLAALSKPLEVSQVDGQLQLRAEGGPLLRFAPAKP